MYVIRGVGVVVCVVMTLPLVVSLVVEDVLDSPNLCFLKGRIVGENLLPYFDGFLVGLAGYFLWVVLLGVVVVLGLVVVTVVEVRESLY